MSLKILGALGDNINSAGALANNITNFGGNTLKTSGINALTNASPLLGTIAGEFVNSTASTGWLARMQARADPHLLHQWEVQVPFGLDPTYIEGIEFSLPQIENIQIYRAGTYIYIAGIKSIASATLTLYEDNQFTTTGWINKWRQSIYDDKGNHRPTSSYKQIITLSPTDMNWSKIGSILLVGTWPTQFPSYPLTSEVIRTQLSLGLAIDDVVINISSGIGSNLVSGFLSSVGAAFPGLSNIVQQGINTLGNDIPGVGAIVSNAGSSLSGAISNIL